MTRVILFGLAVLSVACSTTKPATPPPLIYPGARLLYSNGTDTLITLCDHRGTRVYLTSQGGVAVSPGACGADGLP